MQIELVTKYDINDAQKESLVGEFKPTKEGPYPPADMDWEGGGSKSARGPNTLWHRRKMSLILAVPSVVLDEAANLVLLVEVIWSNG